MSFQQGTFQEWLGVPSDESEHSDDEETLGSDDTWSPSESDDLSDDIDEPLEPNEDEHTEQTTTVKTEEPTTNKHSTYNLRTRPTIPKYSFTSQLSTAKTFSTQPPVGTKVERVPIATYTKQSESTGLPEVTKLTTPVTSQNSPPPTPHDNGGWKTQDSESSSTRWDNTLASPKESQESQTHTSYSQDPSSTTYHRSSGTTDDDPSEPHGRTHLKRPWKDQCFPSDKSNTPLRPQDLGIQPPHMEVGSFHLVGPGGELTTKRLITLPNKSITNWQGSQQATQHSITITSMPLENSSHKSCSSWKYLPRPTPPTAFGSITGQNSQYTE